MCCCTYTDCESVCLYCSTLKKQVPKFNKLAEDLVQTLRGVADGRTWFDLRDHYRNTTLHAISLVYDIIEGVCL